MKKNTLALFLILIAFFSLYQTRHSFAKLILGNHYVYAESEDNEDDERENNKEDDEYEEKVVTSTKEAQVQSTPVAPVAPVVTIDPAYVNDADQDGLVDAIDPDPTIKQQMFFTDTDGDGMADAFDRYPNDDDFKYVFDADLNNNGILDSYEQR